jgi:hypothetical protein
MEAWLLDTPAVWAVEPLEALDNEIRELMSTTSDLETLWRLLALDTKTPYVQRALL